MLRVALQGLRGRKGPFAGAFVALAIAAALVMACGMLLQAGLTSKSPVERYAGAPIVVAGDQNEHINVGTDNEDSVPLYERVRIPASLRSKLRDVQGVRAAIADVGVPAAIEADGRFLDGPTGHPVSLHPWSTAVLTPYHLASGHRPAGDDEVVVDRGLAARGHLHAGERVLLASNGPARTMTVAGIAQTNVAVDRQGVVFASEKTVRQLAAVPARVDAIGIIPIPGTSIDALAQRVREVVGDQAKVHTGASRGEIEHIEDIEARAAVSAIGGTFGGLALMIAMFVVASTIGLSVLLREREMALLRAIAATPKQVRRMIRWETVLVAFVAAIVGIIPGALLAQTLGSALAERGVAPEDMDVAITALPAIVAIASSVLTAVIAVAAAGRRAARVRPTEALQESAGSRRLIGPFRLVAGLAMTGVALVLLAIGSAGHDPTSAADLATGASFALVIAAALLGPLVVRAVAGVASLMLARRHRSVSAFLAVSNMRTAAGRFASAMTPLILTVGISSTLLFSGTTREHVTAAQEQERVTADVVLQSDGAGIPRSALNDVRRTRGVRAAVGVAETTLGPSLGATYSPAQAAVVDPHGLSDVLDLDVQEGSLAQLGPHAVALSESQAAQGGADVGERVKVVLGDGTRVTARVAALYRRGLGFGDIVLPSGVERGHMTSPLLSSVLIRTEPGSADEVARDLRELTRRYPGVVVGDRQDHAARADHDRETNNWLFRILAGILFAFTAVAVVNTLIMIGLHRRRELALLRLVGGTRRQVIRMARWEGAFTVALGLGIGAVIALITLVPTAAALSSSGKPYAPAALLGLVFGSAAAVGLLATQLSTRFALRPRPIEGMGIRE